MRLRPTLGLLAVVCFFGGLACGIVDEFFGLWMGMNLSRLGGGAMVFALHVIIAIGLLVSHERGKLPRLMTAGVVCLLIAPVLWVVILWGTEALGERLWPFAAVASAWPLLIMIVGLVLCQPATRRPARVVRAFTVITAAALGVILPVGVAATSYFHGDGFVLARVMTAGAVLVVSGLFTLLVMGRLRELAELPYAERPTIDLTCPRCGKRQTLVVDGDKCRRCGLGITVQTP